jgi:hypothetical protein
MKKEGKRILVKKKKKDMFYLETRGGTDVG